MKKYILAFILFLSACCTVPQEALDQPKTQVMIYDSYLQLMEAGQTTREQDQSFIKANRRAWHAQNFALNDIPLPSDIMVPGE